MNAVDLALAHRLGSRRFALALTLVCASCGARSCSKTSPLAQASTSVATPVAKPLLALEPCTLELGTDREATRDEVIGLLLPAFHSGNDQLPVQHPQPTSDRAEVAGVFLVQPCRGDAMESLSQPVVGQLQRLTLGDGRELVQFPVGTREGMDEYTLGVLAILGREGHTLRALNISEASADLPGGLAPFRIARIGDAELLLRTEATNPASENSERGSYVSIDFLIGNELHLLGVIWERRSSDETFWRGPFDWQMTSTGAEPTETGYVVHEHWTFEHRKTHRRSNRDVLRRYTIADHRFVESPVDDLDAWPETRSQ